MIYQALFGDKDNAYALLETDHPDKSLVARICNSTDLLSRPGPGIAWLSSVRGFPVGDSYAVMKTYLDNSPNVRYGRVFTHAFIIAKNQLDHIQIERLLASFPPILNKSIRLENFTHQNPIFPINSDLNLNKLSKVWRGFLEDKIVVWLGAEDFSDGVALLWNGMPNEFRKAFEFEISFSPSQISKKGDLVLINTPSSLKNKWENDKRFEVIYSDEAQFQPHEIELFLIGDSTSREFKDFTTSCNFDISDFEKLRAIHAIFKSYKGVSKGDFHKANTALQLTLKHIILKGFGLQLAEMFFSRMITELPRSSCQVVIGIRKLKSITPIHGFQSRIQGALQLWCESNLFRLESNNRESIYLIPGLIAESDLQNWWKETIVRFIQNELGSWDVEKAKVLSIWLVSEKSSSILESLASTISEKRNVELMTATVVADQVTASQAQNFLADFAKYRLYFLHAGLILASELSDAEILHRQLRADDDPNSIDSLVFLKSLMGSERFLIASLGVEIEARLIKLSAQTIAEDPALIKNLSPQIERDQEIIHCLATLSEITKYFNDLKTDLIFPILDRLLAEGPFKTTSKLLHLFTNIDLLDYSQRKKAWNHLDTMGNKYLTNTAKKYIDTLDNKNTEHVEPQLRSEITSRHVLGWYLERYKRDMNKALVLFENFSEVPESYLQDFLYYFDNSINSIESKRLGELVAARDWAMCAGIIFSKCRADHSFRLALNNCFDKLSWLNKLAANFHGYTDGDKVNEDDFWNCLMEVSCKLYSEGPKENKVWKEAGGDNSDLIGGRSGREIWKDSLHRLRYGAFQKVTPKSLIKVMLESFPRNTELKLLKKICKDIWREE